MLVRQTGQERRGQPHCFLASPESAQSKQGCNHRFLVRQAKYQRGKLCKAFQDHMVRFSWKAAFSLEIIRYCQEMWNLTCSTALHCRQREISVSRRQGGTRGIKVAAAGGVAPTWHDMTYFHCLKPTSTAPAPPPPQSLVKALLLPTAKDLCANGLLTDGWEHLFYIFFLFLHF